MTILSLKSCFLNSIIFPHISFITANDEFQHGKTDIWRKRCSWRNLQYFFHISAKNPTRSMTPKKGNEGHCAFIFMQFMPKSIM